MHQSIKIIKSYISKICGGEYIHYLLKGSSVNYLYLLFVFKLCRINVLEYFNLMIIDNLHDTIKKYDDIDINISIFKLENYSDRIEKFCYEDINITTFILEILFIESKYSLLIIIDFNFPKIVRKLYKFFDYVNFVYKDIYRHPYFYFFFAFLNLFSFLIISEMMK